MTDALSNSGFPDVARRIRESERERDGFGNSQSETTADSRPGLPRTTAGERAVLEACRRHRARISISCEQLAADIQRIASQIETEGTLPDA